MIALRYQRGLFLPAGGASALEKLAKEAIADETFLAILKRFAEANRNVSDRTGTNYAPALFAQEEEARKARITGKKLANAMLRLFQGGKIWNEPCGKPSRPSFRLAIKEQS